MKCEYFVLLDLKPGDVLLLYFRGFFVLFFLICSLDFGFNTPLRIPLFKHNLFQFSIQKLFTMRENHDRSWLCKLYKQRMRTNVKTRFMLVVLWGWIKAHWCFELKVNIIKNDHVTYFNIKCVELRGSYCWIWNKLRKKIISLYSILQTFKQDL